MKVRGTLFEIDLLAKIWCTLFLGFYSWSWLMLEVRFTLIEGIYIRPRSVIPCLWVDLLGLSFVHIVCGPIELAEVWDSRCILAEIWNAPTVDWLLTMTWIIMIWYIVCCVLRCPCSDLVYLPCSLSLSYCDYWTKLFWLWNIDSSYNSSNLSFVT